jgi:regulator of protease activity HflC (stomatin/prohibitin superfamily)
VRVTISRRLDNIFGGIVGVGSTTITKDSLAEYQRAPKVTHERLYIETMEQVLPKVRTLIIEPGTATLLPYLPPLAAPAPAKDGGR